MTLRVNNRKEGETMRKQLLYPNAEKLKQEKTKPDKTEKNEPLIIETVNGFCPNYKLFKDTEHALIFCNID